MNRLEISCEAPVEEASMVTTILYPFTSCTSTPSIAARARATASTDSGRASTTSEEMTTFSSSITYSWATGWQVMHSARGPSISWVDTSPPT